MKKLAEFYELIVFTASHQYYADVAIDELDPDHTLFSKRLFRNSCIATDNGLYIKDLRVLNCDLKSTIIVDNAIYSFAFQLDNGIPIIPFYDDKEDKILPRIAEYIISLKDYPDVTVSLKEKLKLTELYELQISSFLKYYYDEEDEESKDELENAENNNELSEEEKKEDSPRAKELKRKAITFMEKPELNPFLSSQQIVIDKKAQACVDHHLDKLRRSLTNYLASSSN